MHGDDDPDVAAFFAKFLNDGPKRIQPPPRRDGRLRQSRYTADVAPMSNGLALGLSGAAAILEDGNGPKKRVISESTEAFHRLLADMANDIMENGPDVEVAASREPTPRSRSRSPTPPPLHRTPIGEFVGALPRTPLSVVSVETEPVQEEEKPQDPPESEYESSEEDSGDDASSDATNIVEPQAKMPTLTDFGQSRPPPSPPTPTNQMRLSVKLQTGKRLLDNVAIELDSSLEDLFVLVEKKVPKQIQTFITRHGVKLERSDIPIKWAGLQDGDEIIAVHHTHLSANERTSPQAASNNLAKSWLSKKFSVVEAGAVSVGAFGDTIATGSAVDPMARGTGESYFRSAAASGAPPSKWGMEPVAEDGYPSANAGAAPSSHWLDVGSAMQRTGVDFNVVPPIPPSSQADEAEPLPTPPACLPDEFDDLPGDAWGTPRDYVEGVEGVSPRVAELASRTPSKPRPNKVAASPTQSKVAASSPPPSATPTSSRLGLSEAPTPSRQPRTDAEELLYRQEVKNKLEEKQKQNDAIWANIAASLEPKADDKSMRRSFLSHTATAASAGSLRKTMQPLSKRH